MFSKLKCRHSKHENAYIKTKTKNLKKRVSNGKKIFDKHNLSPSARIIGWCRTHLRVIVLLGPAALWAGDEKAPLPVQMVFQLLFAFRAWLAAFEFSEIVAAVTVVTRVGGGVHSGCREVRHRCVYSFGYVKSDNCKKRYDGIKKEKHDVWIGIINRI